MSISLNRRIKPRVDCDYPAIIEGYDPDGKRYNGYARLANLSASGLFMKTNRRVENGVELSVLILLAGSIIESDAPKIATNGTVVRTETQHDGTCGVAVKFNRYRFL